jgi:hypothetical protein
MQRLEVSGAVRHICVIRRLKVNAQFSIHYQHVCYTIIFDMFRTLTCPSSGGKIAFTQRLVSTLSVNGCIVHRLRADCCVNAILPPEDGHVNARNMSRIIV